MFGTILEQVCSLDLLYGWCHLSLVLTGPVLLAACYFDIKVWLNCLEFHYVGFWSVGYKLLSRSQLSIFCCCLIPFGFTSWRRHLTHLLNQEHSSENIRYQLLILSVTLYLYRGPSKIMVLGRDKEEGKCLIFTGIAPHNFFSLVGMHVQGIVFALVLKAKKNEWFISNMWATLLRQVANVEFLVRH